MLFHVDPLLRPLRRYKPTVPDMFEWQPLPIAGNLRGPLVCYVLHGTEIARLSQSGGRGDWQATLDQHRPWERRQVRSCTSYASGRRGIELWATRHAGRLLAEVGAIHAARQSPWWRSDTRPVEGVPGAT